MSGKEEVHATVLRFREEGEWLVCSIGDSDEEGTRLEVGRARVGVLLFGGAVLSEQWAASMRALVCKTIERANGEAVRVTAILRGDSETPH